MLQTAGLRLSEYCAEMTWQPCTGASWWRNHVPCRLAYRRVDCRANAAAAGRSVSPAQIRRKLGHAERLHDGQVRRQIERHQRPHLVQRAKLDHPVEAPVAGGVQRFARRIDHDGQEPQPGRRAGCRIGLPCGDRAAGGFQNLDRAQQALGVARLQAGRRFRIALRQQRMKAGAADAGVKVAYRRPYVRRHRRDIRQPLHQRPQVKAGAADDDGQPAGRMGGADLLQRHGLPAGGGASLGCRQDAVQAVGRAGFVGGGRAGGQDRQLAVDLHAVGVDDGAAELLRQVESEC